MRFSTSALLACALFTSCATLVSPRKYPVTISSAPPGAAIVITDVNGVEVYKGKTPAEVLLKSGGKYFQRQQYTVLFTKKNYPAKVLTLSADLNGWYLGNIVLGNVWGMLVIDPLTGAMWRIPKKEMRADLGPRTGWNQLRTPTGRPGLQIVSLDDVPADQLAGLESLPAQ
ncbi:hypothetical protein LJY25_20830 [Hymenobacter sp. BT175]|uniref:hypothetical protein n=1 Tax=Hymenobacter translucens TaxID=2886507 RepID=UPI001D0EA42A|nr:hypothetical protein [Hymenobacter translucens]MCC2548907.1 hypothetical protein [Hymenobacter translucens]